MTQNQPTWLEQREAWFGRVRVRTWMWGRFENIVAAIDSSRGAGRQVVPSKANPEGRPNYYKVVNWLGCRPKPMPVHFSRRNRIDDCPGRKGNIASMKSWLEPRKFILNIWIALDPAPLLH
jgi:hypothetical protein